MSAVLVLTMAGIPSPPHVRFSQTCPSGSQARRLWCILISLSNLRGQKWEFHSVWIASSPRKWSLLRAQRVGKRLLGLQGRVPGFSPQHLQLWGLSGLNLVNVGAADSPPPPPGLFPAFLPLSVLCVFLSSSVGSARCRPSPKVPAKSQASQAKQPNPWPQPPLRSRARRALCHGGRSS